MAMEIAEQTLKLSIRLARRGCTNRPVYDIVVMPKIWRCNAPAPLEKLGVYDPMPNEKDEHIVAVNFERLQVWMGKGATVSRPLQDLLGLAGYFPISPRTYMRAWRNRRKELEEIKKKEEEVEAKKNAMEEAG